MLNEGLEYLPVQVTHMTSSSETRWSHIMWHHCHSSMCLFGVTSENAHLHMEPIIRLAADIKSLLKHQPNDAAFKAVLKLSDIIKSMVCHSTKRWIYAQRFDYYAKQSETASDQVLQRANTFFKNDMLPLYQSVTDLALRVVSKLFEQVIHRACSLQEEQAVLLKSLPCSIASGLLVCLIFALMCAGNLTCGKNFLEVDKKCTACNSLRLSI